MKIFFSRRLWILTMFVLTVMALNSPVWAQAAARQESDGRRQELVMENEFWKLTIWPDLGARIMHAVYKPTGHDWIFNDAGLFCDHVTQQVWPGELMKAAYQTQIINAGPEEAAVRVWHKIDGKGDAAIAGVVFERDMTLRRGDPRLHVVIRLKNESNAQRSPTLWIQNMFYVGGGKTDNHCFRPSTTGIQEGWTEYTSTQIKRNGIEKIPDPTAGWSAVTNTVNGEGVVFLMTYNDLFWLYNCITFLTAEWWYDPVPLAPGASWETPVTMMPFEGLTSVAYADRKLIASLDTAYQDLKLGATLKLLSPSAEEISMISGELTLISWPEQKVLKTEKFSIPRIGAKPVPLTFDLGTLPKTQEAVIRIKLTAGQYIASFEKFFDPMLAEKIQFGQVNSDYRLAKPHKEKHFALPDGARVERHEHPRVLLYEGMHTSYWGLDEAFRHLNVPEIKLSHHIFFVYGDQLDYMVSSPAELLQYDLIILSNIPADALTDVGQTFLKLYVEHGGSLLILGGNAAYGAGSYGEGDLSSLIPVKVGTFFDRAEIKDGGILTPSGKLGKNIFTDWPQGKNAPRVYWMHQTDSLQPGAEVVMKAGDRPAIVVSKIGAGRVAAVLLTPSGVPAEGQTGFWECKSWPQQIANLMNWIQDKKGDQ